MIVVTGAAGFIGSCMVRKLNHEGHVDLVLVDRFSDPGKKRNLENKQHRTRIERDDFLAWFEANAGDVNFVYHLGARTDTTEFDERIFDRLNVSYSKSVWQICTRHQIPLVYASSAATYGLGDHGYSDAHDVVNDLEPLNPYGWSKQIFDRWVLEQVDRPPMWAGMKFFNVYGPNEYHKGRMASVVFHAFRQISETGGMKLFRSHRPGVEDGHQSRDFIYINDVVDACYFFQSNSVPSGIYNLGTGKARTFLDLIRPIFDVLKIDPDISFIDTPADIRDTYQYFTEADMTKLIGAGYHQPFIPVETGVADYVEGFLKEHKYL